jgi:pSer/pThr/pTyr-binding forkhead associated (FHA) protein
MEDQTWRAVGTPSATGVTGLLVRPSADGHGAPVAAVRHELLIGRGENAGLLLPGSPVSRQHARVWTSGGRFWVEDLGSRNGTFVNGRRIAGPTGLRDGDVLQVGDVELHFRVVGRR